MSNNETILGEKKYMYGSQRDAYMRLNHKQKKIVCTKIGIDGRYIYRILRIQEGGKPMRAGYLTLLNEALKGFEA